MKLNHEPDPALCQVRPGLVKQCQRVSEVFRLQGDGRLLAARPCRPQPLRRSDRSCGHRRETAGAPVPSRPTERRTRPHREPAATTTDAVPGLRRFLLPTVADRTAPPTSAAGGSRRGLASMRTDATVRFVCGSTAVAVCVLLCGSTPMIIIAAKVLPFCRVDS